MQFIIRLSKNTVSIETFQWVPFSLEARLRVLGLSGKTSPLVSITRLLSTSLTNLFTLSHLLSTGLSLYLVHCLPVFSAYPISCLQSVHDTLFTVFQFFNHFHFYHPPVNFDLPCVNFHLYPLVSSSQPV